MRDETKPAPEPTIEWKAPDSWAVDHEYLRVPGARLPLADVRALVGSLLILEATTTERSRPDLSKLRDLADDWEGEPTPSRSPLFDEAVRVVRAQCAYEIREVLAEIEGKS